MVAPSPPCPSRRTRPVVVVLAALAAFCAVAPAASADWLRPVPGDLARPFDYGRDPFAPGQHRGVDLAAPPGAPVRSACDGVVAFVGRTPRHGRVVSVRCGERRVSYLPLGGAAVRRGESIGRGDRVGTVGDGHGGALHVGVRGEASRFAYVDPLGLFGDEAATPPAVLPRIGPPPRRAPRLRARPRGAPRVRAPVPVSQPARILAPWPVWLGLALLLLSAAGGTTLAVRRRRRSVRRRRLVLARWTA